MRTDPTKAKDAPARRPLKLLLWTAVASLIFGLIGFGEIVEDPLRVIRNAVHPTNASGDIVMIGIDDRSLRDLGEWPWPRARHAELIDHATQLGARKIFMDSLHEGPTDQRNDEALANALARSGRVVMPARERFGAKDESEVLDGMPMPMFAKHVDLASVSLFYNYQHAVWQLPYTAIVAGHKIPSFAAALADGRSQSSGRFRLDYSIDPATVPYVRASDLLNGRVNRAAIAGKQVVIGTDADQIGDEYWIPGRGRMAGALVHIIGAETLKQGRPIDLSFWPAWLVGLGVCTLALLRTRGVATSALLVGSALLMLIGPVVLEANLVFVDVMPGIFAILCVGMRLAWLRWRSRGLVNGLSGLPNLAALRSERGRANQALVAARIHNYAEIASTLDAKAEATFVSQLVQRLSLTGGIKPMIYQGDEGIFSWFVEPDAPLANQLEALHALFRSPLSIAGQAIDVALTFGVELGSGRSMANRLGSALVAADEAWEEGLRSKYHDPARQEQVSWRLSLLGQLDAAIDHGEVWIAYQPQLDLQRQRIVGAEALARWTHPEKGPISPTEFVAAAEQQGRIGKLTDFVLDRAIATAAAINRRGTDFTIAVNISARLLTDRDLTDRVMRLLSVHGLKPDKLTLELTETEALHGSDGGIAVLDALHARGVRIAIDDYGTGLSTLDYLKKVPADEIKIDQSFIKAMRVNRSDLIMVQSTIALAHSLGRTVVAEGVEDRDLLDQLAQMQCDVAQGYAIGRPMGVRELVQRLQVRSTRRVA
jgi:EAL domain-containing protein (putative c-di-GMP-specific phosphodiesterase class I)/CHASE2 domain-containing sensor protein